MRHYINFDHKQTQQHIRRIQSSRPHPEPAAFTKTSIFYGIDIDIDTQSFTYTSTAKQPDSPPLQSSFVYVHAFNVCAPSAGFPDRMNRLVLPYKAYGVAISLRTWSPKVSLTHLMGAVPHVFSLTVAYILSAQVGVIQQGNDRWCECRDDGMVWAFGVDQLETCNFIDITRSIGDCRKS